MAGLTAFLCVGRGGGVGAAAILAAIFRLLQQVTFDPVSVGSSNAFENFRGWLALQDC